MEQVLPERRAKAIGLTALIDVVFILLMFFMLTSTFSHWQSIKIPSASATKETTDEAPVLVLIYSDSSLRILTDSLSEPMNKDEIIATLPTGKDIVVSAVEDAPVQSILDVLASLREHKIVATLGQPFEAPES